jgi:hypothetical protein
MVRFCHYVITFCGAVLHYQRDPPENNLNDLAHNRKNNLLSVDTFLHHSPKHPLLRTVYYLLFRLWLMKGFFLYGLNPALFQIVLSQITDYSIIFFSSALLGKTSLYLLAKICLLLSGRVISTIVSFLSLQRIIPMVLFSSSSFTKRS